MFTALDLFNDRYNSLTTMIRDYCTVRNYLCGIDRVDFYNSVISVRDLSAVGSTKEVEYDLYFDKDTSMSIAYTLFVEWVEREFTTKPVKELRIRLPEQRQECGTCKFYNKPAYLEPCRICRGRSHWQSSESARKEESDNG